MTRELLDALEVRFSEPADDGTLEGVAVRFDVVDTYGSSFDPRAFAALEGRSIPMLWSHRQDEVLGSWSSVTADADGLRVRGRLNLEVQRAREARAMLLASDIRGLSIGFETLKAEMRGGVRRITKAVLHEISLVAMPSVPGARVTTVRASSPRGDVAAFVAAVRRAAQALEVK
jgi:HK97 family phage prohead protease